MKQILLLISLLFAVNAFSQTNDSLLKKYDNELIYRYGSSFMKGTDKLSFNALQGEFKNPSLPFDLYQKAKRNKTVGTVLRYVSLLAIVGVAKGARDNNMGMVYGFMGGQLALGITGIMLNQKSLADTDRAIRLYNRELLFPGR